MVQGVIIKALSGFYYVDTGAEVLTCRARGKFRKEGLSPLVWDRVTVRELGNGEGFVESVLPRKNAFERPAVANIDQLVVIGSAAIPKTDPFLIDRIAAIGRGAVPHLYRRRVPDTADQRGDRRGSEGIEASDRR